MTRRHQYLSKLTLCFGALALITAIVVYFAADDQSAGVLSIYPKLYRAAEGGEAFLFVNSGMAIRRMARPRDPFLETTVRQPVEPVYDYDICEAVYQGTPDYTRMSGGLEKCILVQDVIEAGFSGDGAYLYIASLDKERHIKLYDVIDLECPGHPGKPRSLPAAPAGVVLREVNEYFK